MFVPGQTHDVLITAADIQKDLKIFMESFAEKLNHKVGSPMDQYSKPATFARLPLFGAAAALGGNRYLKKSIKRRESFIIMGPDI